MLKDDYRYRLSNIKPVLKVAGNQRIILNAS